MITYDQAMLLEDLLIQNIQAYREEASQRDWVPFHDPEQMERLLDRANVLQHVRELIHSVETGDALYEEEKAQ
jgi:hypothetical protein